MATAASIAEVQLHDGMIPWFEGGHCDPWNHVESAMALSVAGLHKEATLAYQWLADAQLPDGSWFNYYLAASGVKDPRLDTNVCAYVATGAWHHYRVTGDVSVSAAMWPVLDKALEFVLRFQRDDGAMLWSVDPDGQSGSLPAAHRVLVDLPRAAMWCGVRGDPRGRAPRLGARRGSTGAHDRACSGGVRAQTRVRHGLVLPDALGCAVG